MSEKNVCQASASVMIYDEQMKKWKPAGTSQGIARVCIYKREGGPPSFRVVGRKETDHEVVINCSITRNLKYNKATMTFHQWRDARMVYGLNFRSPDDANTFAQGMENAIGELSSDGGSSIQAEQEAKRREQQRLEEERIERERRERERQEAERRERERQEAERRARAASSASSGGGGVPPPPPAPAAPPPPPAPPAPPAAPAPPPASSGGGGGGGGAMDMASALAAVKLKKAEPVEEKAASGGGGGGGGGDFLGELQKRMAAKRANKGQDSAAPKPASNPPQSLRAEPSKRPAWQKSTSQSGSATLGRVGSTNSLNGSSGDLESMKQEILTEVRAEIRKMKDEIISAIRQELSNR